MAWRDTVEHHLTLLTAEPALTRVGKRGIAIRVQPRSDAFERASDLRTCDVIEEKHLANFLPRDQIDLEPELVVMNHDGGGARDCSRVHLISRIHESAIDEVEDGRDVIQDPSSQVAVERRSACFAGSFPLVSASPNERLRS
jgi:hypothetical protein